MTQMLAFNQNENYFQKYYLSFKRFEIVLKNIKEFTTKISKQYEKCMKFFASDDQKIMEAERVGKLDCGVKDIHNKLDTMNILRTRQPDNIHAQRIDQSHLYEPPLVLFVKSFVVQNLTLLLGNSIKIIILSQSPYVLKFYGLSNIDCYDVMVFDWAEFGTLKKRYNKFDIPWTRKIQIVRDICRGLVSLRSASVLHHDMRCKNFFILHYLDPKIGNFKSSRKLDAKTRDLFHLVPAWKHIPYERICVTELQKVFEQLAATYPIPPDAPILLENKTLNFDGSIASPESENDERRAIELFKDAADSDHPDAQFRNVVLLLNNLRSEQNIARKNELCEEILHYFKLTANNKNHDTTYYLSDIYLNGKLNVEKK
ncbi:12476_t:CDS:2 [Dentiscutata heterogama]|uniref:12476_t:CDS:1 n=1 Tax=Dentiscutata heterogama TaxID=1316150 RepID=A0ACA9KQ80_9GLOM|nr:12476_t:CDS:2 [Dentiscutata heterogama]